MFDTSEFQNLVDKTSKPKYLCPNHVLSVHQIARVVMASPAKSRAASRQSPNFGYRVKRVNLRRELALAGDTLSARINGENAFNERGGRSQDVTRITTQPWRIPGTKISTPTPQF
ncbi:hypothetical protein BGZ73_004020 [Actinomortierella ambigua]|nr:hypothetical protein BGZ73_004020 [Actinomortierella ambigua]